MISIQSEGRRHYLVGDTYALRDALRDAGAKWDPDHRAWWTGKKEVAEALVARLGATPDAPTVRRGTRRSRSPVAGYGALLEIPSRVARDDGRTLVHAGIEGVDAFLPLCADCHVGRLRWAEAGYVPWHRICDVCGSHWDLHPIPWGPARPSRPVAARLPEHAPTCASLWEDEWSDAHGGRPCSCAALPRIDAARADHEALLARSGGLVLWVDHRGEVPLDPSEPLPSTERLPHPPTWADLVALLTPAHWEAAEREAARKGMIVVPCAWARRARFY